MNLSFNSSWWYLKLTEIWFEPKKESNCWLKFISKSNESGIRKYWQNISSYHWIINFGVINACHSILMRLQSKWIVSKAREADDAGFSEVALSLLALCACTLFGSLEVIEFQRIIRSTRLDADPLYCFTYYFMHFSIVFVTYIQNKIQQRWKKDAIFEHIWTISFAP